MKINLEVLKQLIPIYGVGPVDKIPGVQQLLHSGGNEKAPQKYESLLTGAGYEWSDDDSAYHLDDQVMCYFVDKEIFLWVWQESLVRVLNNSEQIRKWTIGDDKYPEGKANSFMGIYLQKTGQSKGEEGGLATAEPDSNEPEDRMAGATSGDITFSGTGARKGDYEPKEMDPADAIIVRTKKKMGKNGTLPADDIIDLYQQAKKMGSNKLMTFIKTIKPLKEGSVKASTLQEIIRHIVKSVVKEGYQDFGKTGNGAESDNHVLSIADKTWGSPGGKQWRIVKSKGGPQGTVYQLQVTHPISRFVWKTTDGAWKVLDPKTKQWSDVQSDVKEMTGCAAAGPVTGPNAFKKKTDEIYAMSRDPSSFPPDGHRICPVCNRKGYKHKQASPYNYCDMGHAWKAESGDVLMNADNVDGPIFEMTTTSGGGGSSPGTPGYNIPGAFAKKGGSVAGVEGSEALGYTLTPAGKKEMQRSADKLYEGKKKK